MGEAKWNSSRKLFENCGIDLENWSLRQQVQSRHSQRKPARETTRTAPSNRITEARQAMSGPTNSTDSNTTQPAAAERSTSGVAGVGLSILGCLGWVGLVPLLDSYNQSEQLARFFAALFNQIVLGVIGGTATILLLLGLKFARMAKSRGNAKIGQLGQSISYVGLGIGGLVLILYLPGSILMML